MKEKIIAACDDLFNDYVNENGEITQETFIEMCIEERGKITEQLKLIRSEVKVAFSFLMNSFSSFDVVSAAVTKYQSWIDELNTMIEYVGEINEKEEDLNDEN